MGLLTDALRLSRPTHARPHCSSRPRPRDVVLMEPDLVTQPIHLHRRGCEEQIHHNHPLMSTVTDLSSTMPRATPPPGVVVRHYTLHC
jgi:hypothetical protein